MASQGYMVQRFKGRIENARFLKDIGSPSMILIGADSDQAFEDHGKQWFPILFQRKACHFVHQAPDASRGAVCGKAQ